MTELDEVPLVREGESTIPHPPPARVRSTPVFAIAVVGLALGGAAAWWWTRDRPPVEPMQQGQSASEGVVADAAHDARPLPPLGQMDTFLRALLGALSSSPQLARWLSTDDLIRQMASGVDRISRGLSPAKDLAVLRPRRELTVNGRFDQWTIDTASYDRYDSLSSLVSSLDARRVAEAYRTIQPRLDQAYRALGQSDSGIDHAVSVALQLLIDTPVVRDPVRVVSGKGATYAYADPTLEQSFPVQKQLIRMGPENLERIRTRLRDIKTAIETTSAR